jgi:hypothetical protein
LPNDDVYYFFHDYDDLFFRKNVKEELHSRSTFYKLANFVEDNKLGITIDSLEDIEKELLELSEQQMDEIECNVLHFINEDNFRGYAFINS